MAIPTISDVAGVITEPELRHTANGKAVLNMRFAFNDSRYNDQTQQWENTRTFYVDGTAWEDVALRLADQIRSGDQVYVEGRLETQEWEKDGQKRSKPNLTVRTVRKLEKAQQPPQSAPQSAPSNAWGAAPTGDVWDGGGQQQSQHVGNSDRFNQQQTPPPASNQQASAFGQMSQGQDVWGGGQPQQGQAPPF